MAKRYYIVATLSIDICIESDDLSACDFSYDRTIILSAMLQSSILTLCSDYLHSPFRQLLKMYIQPYIPLPPIIPPLFKQRILPLLHRHGRIYHARKVRQNLQ